MTNKILSYSSFGIAVLTLVLVGVLVFGSSPVKLGGVTNYDALSLSETLSVTGVSTMTGGITSAGTLTQSGAAVFSGNTSVVQSASSSIYVGGADNTGCIVLGDSSAPTSTNKVYITATGATISATTTKPQICR